MNKYLKSLVRWSVYDKFYLCILSFLFKLCKINFLVKQGNSYYDFLLLFLWNIVSTGHCVSETSTLFFAKWMIDIGNFEIAEHMLWREDPNSS